MPNPNITLSDETGFSPGSNLYLGAPFFSIVAGNWAYCGFTNCSDGQNLVSGGTFQTCRWGLHCPVNLFTGGVFLDGGSLYGYEGATTITGGSWGGPWTIGLALQGGTHLPGPATLTFEGSGFVFNPISGILTGTMLDGQAINITIMLDKSNGLNTHLVLASSTEVMFSA